jgi:hypothetical protein
MSDRYTFHPHFGFDLFKSSSFGNVNVAGGGFGYGFCVGVGAGDGLGVGKEIEVGSVNGFGGGGLSGGSFGDGFSHGLGSGNVAGGFVLAAHVSAFRFYAFQGKRFILLLPQILQRALGFSVPLLGRLAKPVRRFLQIFGNANAVLITLSQTILSIGIPLFCRLAI